MKTAVNVHEARTHASRLLERVAAGERIVIAKAGRIPIVTTDPLIHRFDVEAMA